ncbi:hypothetical protein HELRODRAFT_172927 [Helobdella robusta]|uniref:Uncharacterized protein n=1 Tax=Helobdella robusta TaxID=6412 RepID=T1F654_HELRO|nr:hypothetical protein HELRODRAFT_172927 [Helobdella robusta]ESO03899.1 hypothetical protein HELRODRAFT_172927 [Helobdella robusta]
MPRGSEVHTTKRLSGCQQRKAKIKKDEILSTLRGSMMQYVKGSDEAQSSSKDTVPQPQNDETNLSDAEIELLLEIPRLRRYLKAAEIDLEEAKDWSVYDCRPRQTEVLLVRSLLLAYDCRAFSKWEFRVSCPVRRKTSDPWTDRKLIYILYPSDDDPPMMVSYKSDLVAV